MERPIILKAHEVRGILDGRQTQLRRIIKPQPNVCASEVIQMGDEFQFGLYEYIDNERFGQMTDSIRCPFGQAGDRLWGREAFWPFSNGDVAYKADDCWVAVDEDGRTVSCAWKPSTNMTRQNSRILLEIVSVRVERLQDISEADARANGHPIDHNGIPYDPPPREVDSWQGYGRYSFMLSPLISDQAKTMGTKNLRDVWNANPWVWVLEFKRVDA